MPKFSRDLTKDCSLICPLVYWLANSSELLNFLKNDIDFNSPNRQKSKQSNMTKSILTAHDALHVLAETVDHCFYYLRSLMNVLLQPWMPCLAYPGDLDLQVYIYI